MSEQTSRKIWKLLLFDIEYYLMLKIELNNTD